MARPRHARPRPGWLPRALVQQVLICLLLICVQQSGVAVRVQQRQSSPLWQFTSGLNRIALADLRNSVLQPQPNVAQSPAGPGVTLKSSVQQQQQQQQSPPPPHPMANRHSLFDTLAEVASSPNPGTDMVIHGAEPPQEASDASATKEQVAQDWQAHAAAEAAQQQPQQFRTESARMGGQRHVLTNDGELVDAPEDELKRPEGAPPFPPRPTIKWDFASPSEGWNLQGGASLFQGVPPHSSLVVLDGRSGFVALQPFALKVPFTLVLVASAMDVHRDWTLLELSQGQQDRIRLLNIQGELVVDIGQTKLQVPKFWSLDDWVHLSLVVGADMSVYVYKNGVLAAKDQMRGPQPSAELRETCLLGRGADWGEGLFAGEVDVMHYYAWPLQPEEVKNHFEYWKSVDCEISGWQEWGPCSRECGGGIRYRQRSIQVPPARWGVLCPPLGQREICNEQPCRQDCLVSDWSGFSECSAPCGGGSRSRSRTMLVQPQAGGALCPELQQTEACNPTPCPVDCVLGDWTPWGECSERCGGGVRLRRRPVLVAAQHGGAACPTPLEESRPCNQSPCPVDCELGDWGAWGECSKLCGGGQRTRARPMLVQPQASGEPCEPSLETEVCNVEECNVNCEVSEWSTWGDCSQPCGTGVRSRSRRVLTPASGLGQRCGPEIEYGPCNPQPCAPPPTTEAPSPEPTPVPTPVPQVVVIPAMPAARPPAVHEGPKLIAEIVDSFSDGRRVGETNSSPERAAHSPSRPGEFVAPFILP